MTISKRSSGYQVRLYHKGQRYSSQVNGSYSEAADREQEMLRTLRVYGQWPRPAGAEPVAGHADDPAILYKAQRRVDFKATAGTIAKACAWAEREGWKDRRYNGVPYLRTIGSWLILDEGLRDLSEITSATVAKYIDHRRRQDITASTINKELSALEKTIIWALDQTPPLITRRPTWKRATPDKIAKWWLPPEKLEELLVELRSQVDRGDLLLFSDYIELIAKTGLRVEEALRLKVRHYTGEQTLLVPGTKTLRSQATIAIMPRAEEIIVGRIRSVKDDPEALLFPFGYPWAAARWSECRGLLGAHEVSTATLKALRRTFAKIATGRGMPTATLQDILRHESITTTQGYLAVVGDEQKLQEQKKWLT
jgi:site-specific recombinase XerD